VLFGLERLLGAKHGKGPAPGRARPGGEVGQRPSAPALFSRRNSSSYRGFFSHKESRFRRPGRRLWLAGGGIIQQKEEEDEMFNAAIDWAHDGDIAEAPIGGTPRKEGDARLKASSSAPYQSYRNGECIFVISGLASNN